MKETKRKIEKEIQKTTRKRHRRKDRRREQLRIRDKDKKEPRTLRNVADTGYLVLGSDTGWISGTGSHAQGITYYVSGTGCLVLGIWNSNLIQGGYLVLVLWQ
jgi:hypothetical protein